MKRFTIFMTLVIVMLVGKVQAQTLYVPGGTGGIGNNTTNGNVGIGTSFPSSYEHGGTNKFLEIYNQGTSIHSQSHIILSTGVSSIAESSIGTISWTQPNVSTVNKGIGLINMVSDSNNPSAPAGKMIFYTRSSTDASWNERMRIASNGNVGIGVTTPPQQKFQVQGNVLISGASSTLLFRGTATTDWGYWGIEYEATAKGLNFWTPYTSPNGLQNYCLFINDNGNIGIGTNDTKGYKLAVKGSIITEKVVVKLQGNWSDFVFTENYKIRSLSEIESYIKVHKHLPDVPSANEVKEKGIDVGEMNAILLMKIEEMTLMMIEQNKSIEALKAKINGLQNK